MLYASKRELFIKIATQQLEITSDKVMKLFVLSRCCMLLHTQYLFHDSCNPPRYRQMTLSSYFFANCCSVNGTHFRYKISYWPLLEWLVETRRRIPIPKQSYIGIQIVTNKDTIRRSTVIGTYCCVNTIWC